MLLFELIQLIIDTALEFFKGFVLDTLLGAILPAEE